MADPAAAPRGASSFGVAFAILPAPQRDAIRAVHAFSRRVDDSVDEEPNAGRGRTAVARWREEIAACYGGAPAEDVTRALRPHIERFEIPRAYLEELLNGVEMDLTQTRYPSFAELYRYCYRVASTVGLICLRIFGDAEERGRGYAENLGIALQLTNILRDLGSDYARGRIYLPTEELAAHGYSEEALARGDRGEAFVRLMRFQVDRARAFFAEADREVRALDRRPLVAAEIMGRVYRRLLDRIEASRYDVFRREIRVPRLERCWIAASTVLAAARAR